MFNPLALFSKKQEPKFTAADVDQAISLVQNFGGGGRALSWKDMFGNHNPAHVNSSAKQMELAAVYCAVNMYVGAITSLPRFSQRVDPATKQPLRYVSTMENPASRIWSHYANDELSSDNLLKLMVYDLLYSDGNFYALRKLDGQGKTTEISYIHPSRVPRGAIFRSEGSEKLSTGLPARKGELIYRISSGTSDRDEEALYLTSANVVHMIGNIPDPEYHRGMGIMENNARSAGLYDSAEEMGSKFYKRGYTNQMFLGTEAHLTPKVRKGMEDLMNNETGGSAIEDMFKTRILERGLKPIHVGIPLEQMQFIETRAFSVEDVGRWFNIPPVLLHSVMGTGATDPAYDTAMVFWIQNGLGSMMTCLSSNFRDTILKRSSQPLYKFDFNRLHLYKTLLSEFSTALRNLFEIGGITRLDVAGLLGVFIDPKDKTNTQRYVPSNLITVEHSLQLEEKATKSIDVMDQQLEDMELDRGMKQESHKQGLETQQKINDGTLADPNAAPPPGVEKPGQDDNDKSQDESNSDKKTRPVPTREDNQKPKVSNVVKTALYNVFKGLHDYECRVAQQKLKSRPDDFHQAMDEWRNKTFNAKVAAEVGHWGMVTASLVENGEWTAEDILNIQPVPENCEPENYVAEATLRFNSAFGFLIEESNDDLSGTE